jgi:hypothetical protein
MADVTAVVAAKLGMDVLMRMAAMAPMAVKMTLMT